MITSFLNILFGSAISTLVGSIVGLLVSYNIISKRARVRYQPLFLFNDVMMLSIMTLIWYYVDNLYLAYLFFIIMSSIFLVYKLLVAVYSMDKRFRLLVLSLGADHSEYSRFILEKNLGRFFANVLKFYVLCIIGFLTSLTIYASDIGFFGLIVGLVFSIVQTD
ncbi:MAG: hypothetical protein ACUVQF_09105 [Fervidobacterium sp.]|uniref:hypothetical protein n=1 Tax=Fervidobacterium sp. TaxID=1871331 RepID=UPI00404A4F44